MPSVFSGALLRALISDRDLRVEEMATLTGLSFRYLDRLCRGQARPSTRTIEVLADVLGCEPGDLFADDGTSRALPPPGGKPPPPLSAATREQLRRLLDLSGGRHDAA
jgi:transcriptional regulator with XRE-family HTH domain